MESVPDAVAVMPPTTTVPQTRSFWPWALLCAGLAVALGFAMLAGLTKGWDKAGLSAMAMRRGADPDALIALAQGLTWLGDESRRWLIAAGFAAFLAWKKRHRAAIVLLVAPALAGVGSSLLKEAFARPRPALVPHLDHVTNLSFPSGHASGAMAVLLLAALLVPQRRRGLWLGLALAGVALIGASRMMLGVHWPSDVIGGWLWGAAWALGGAMVVQSPLRSRGGGGPALIP